MKNEKITFFIFSIFILSLASLLGIQCISEPEPAFVLEPLMPPATAEPTPEEVVIKPAEVTPRPVVTPKPTAAPVVIMANVAEVLSKTQIIVTVGEDKAGQGIKEGLVGIIYSDKSLSQPIGKAKLTSIKAKFSYATVSETTQNINKSAIVVFTITR